MNQQFFEKIFPTQGNLCVASIDKDGNCTPRFADNVEAALKIANDFAGRNHNVYFTPGTYTGYRRKQDQCVSVKSFFLDLDVRHGKKRYESKEAALLDLQRFCGEINWPQPTLIDSGGGIHAYWIFDEEISGDSWDTYAAQFKQLCLDHNLIIDEGVPADSARLMRVPGSLNHRYDPPEASSLLTDVVTYKVEDLIPALSQVAAPTSFVLDSVEKGLDPDTLAIYEKRNGNFEYDFSKIAQSSLEGEGCAQIKHIIENAATCEEPLWYAGLSVAVRCRDGETAIHLMSEDHPEYSYDETERKAAQSLREANWAHGCSAFEKENRNGCDGCPHRGNITGPIELGKIIKIAEQPIEPIVAVEQTENEEESIRYEANTQKILVFPDYLLPYQRGINGGIYYTPPPRRDKKGKLIQDDPELMTPNDVYPVKRIYSPHDGECLLMHLHLPMDKSREFLLPLKDVTSQERMKSILASNGVVFEPTQGNRIASYLMKWSAYLIETQRADIMRVQQGWTEDQKTFVLGTQEISKNEVRYCPPSPLSKGIVRLITQSGSYEAWKTCAQMFNDPGYELHAFTLLCGLASPLMELTNVNGVTLSLYSEGPGTGKTGALYGAMSVWGNPKRLSVYDSTGNGLIQRMITSKNICYGLDEQGDLDPKLVSHLIYNISSGAPKIRLMSSTNQEREMPFNTNLIAVTTTNKSLRSILQDYRDNTSAQNIRMLEPTVTAPSVPGYELDAERGKVMFDPFNYNYGHAGPDLIHSFFNEGIENIRRRIDIEYLKVAETYTNNAGYRFLSNLLSVTRVAGEIARKYQIVDFDLDRIFNVVGDVFNDMIAGRKRDEATGRVDILGDFINKNIQNSLVIRDDKVTTEPRGPLYVRAEVDTGHIYISTSAMKEYLRSIKSDVRQFEDQLKAKGVLKDRVRKQMATGWKDAFGTTNVWAYEIAMDISHLFPKDVEETPT